jgi:hypothetical protein
VRRAAQGLRAFYERRDRLRYAIASYVRHELPPLDRRTSAADDRDLALYARRASDIAPGAALEGVR